MCFSKTRYLVSPIVLRQLLWERLRCHAGRHLRQMYNLPGSVIPSINIISEQDLFIVMKSIVDIVLQLSNTSL